MKFTKAYEQMKKGKTIWRSVMFGYLERGSLVTKVTKQRVNLHNGRMFVSYASDDEDCEQCEFFKDDLDATDWEVVNELD